MTIFNSLGSNYDLAFALRAEFSFGGKRARRELIEYLNKRYNGETTLTYKGRDAITLALKALVGGDKVAINGFTCIALYDAVVAAGMTPVLLDIEKGGLDFSPATLEEMLANDASIRAVIIQNTLGFPCAGKEIATLCKARGVVLIEDLAHSIGARYEDGTEAGGLGDAVVLSFGQDKAVDAVSGGALVMRNGTHAQNIQAPEIQVSFKRQLKDRFYPRFTWDIRSTYRWYGKAEHAALRAFHILPRPLENGIGSYALPDWYTPLIARQFAQLPKVQAHRRTIAEIYAQALDTKVVLPRVVSTVSDSANLRFPILVNDRNALIQKLRTRGVHVSDIWYDAPIAPKKYAARSAYERGTCPNGEYVSEHILNLPTHINVSPRQAAYIAREVNAFLDHDR